MSHQGIDWGQPELITHSSWAIFTHLPLYLLIGINGSSLQVPCSIHSASDIIDSPWFSISRVSPKSIKRILISITTHVVCLIYQTRCERPCLITWPHHMISLTLKNFVIGYRWHLSKTFNKSVKLFINCEGIKFCEVFIFSCLFVLLLFWL